MSRKEIKIDRFQDLKKWNNDNIAGLLESEDFRAVPINDVSISGLTRQDLQEKIERAGDCSDFVIFGEDEKGQISVVSNNYCGVTATCRICSQKIQAQRFEQIKPFIKEMIEKKYYPYHLILTIKNGEDLHERITAIKDSFKRLRKKGQVRRYTNKNGEVKIYYSKGEYRKVRGAVLTWEIKRGENSKLYHPHAHLLCFTDEPLNYEIYDQDLKKKLYACYGFGNVPQECLDKIIVNTSEYDNKTVPISKLSGEWLDCTNREGINIKPIPIKERPKYSRWTGGDMRRYSKEIFKECREVLKYMTKFNEGQQGNMVQVFRDTANMRFYSKLRDLRKTGPKKEYDFKSVKKFLSTYDTDYLYYNPLEEIGCKEGPNEEELSALWKKCMGSSAKIQGQYRADRKAYIEVYRDGRENPYTIFRDHFAPAKHENLYQDLNEMKAEYRKRVRIVWREYYNVKTSREQTEQRRQWEKDFDNKIPEYMKDTLMSYDLAFW